MVMRVNLNVGKTLVNEYKIFKNSRRAGQLSAAKTGKKIASPVMQAKYLKKHVGLAPVVGFTAGAVSPIPGGCIAGYIIGRIASCLSALAKNIIK